MREIAIAITERANEAHRGKFCAHDQIIIRGKPMGEMQDREPFTVKETKGLLNLLTVPIDLRGDLSWLLPASRWGRICLRKRALLTLSWIRWTLVLIAWGRLSRSLATCFATAVVPIKTTRGLIVRGSMPLRCRTDRC